jgi:hypothetical protein
MSVCRAAGMMAAKRRGSKKTKDAANLNASNQSESVEDDGVLVAELADSKAETSIDGSSGESDESSLLRSGRYDLGENNLFRDLWFILFYLGFAMPFAFVGYWGRSLGMAEFGIDKYVATTMFMVVQIPFFLRLVWAVPVERHNALPLGRRRTWMLAGSVGHILILLPLVVIDIAASPWLWISLVMVSLIPRLFAEQATAGMMAESVPQLGRANSMINLAYRGGPHMLMLLMGWWVAGGAASPFSDAGVIDYATVKLASVGILLLAMLSGIAITIMMREGRPLRGPRALESSSDSTVEKGLRAGRQQKQPRQAKTLAEAAADPTLAFPAATGWFGRMIAAMRTRTQWLILVACILLPLGDGFEAWFTAFLVEVGEMDGPEITKWINIFAVVNYLGLIGPWLSDKRGRQGMLRLYAIGSIVCYFVLGVMMLSGVDPKLILIVWMPTLVLTDWMMFTFITTWADVADARLGATHMGLYQTVHAVSATFIMVGLGGLLLYSTGDSYGALFLAAAAGPLLGLLVFSRLRLDDELGLDVIDSTSVVERWQRRVAKLPWAPAVADSPASRKAMGRAVLVAALLLLIPAAAAVPLFNWDDDDASEEWYPDWQEQSFSTEVGNTISKGGSIEARVDMDRGGEILVNYSVTYQGDHPLNGATCNPVWRAELATPKAIEHTDGSNDSRWEEDMWEGSAQSIVGTPEPNFTATSSDELQSKITALRGDIGWMWGKGEYLLTLRYLDDDSVCPFPNTATWMINLTVSQWREPLFTAGEFNFTVIESSGGVYRFGTTVGVLLGLPILVAAPALMWLVGRDPENPFDTIESS